MKKLTTLFSLGQYGGWAAFLSLFGVVSTKILRRPSYGILQLGNYRWAVHGTRSSGLHFFNEVIVKNAYAPIERDIRDFQNPVILDIGANCGAFALWALSLNSGARLYSYEPGEAFENLSANRDLYLQNHAGGNWTVEKWALSSSTGILRFSPQVNSSMGNLSTEGTDSVQAYALDDLGLAADILKIDVEGHETDVLKGADRGLDRARVIILEYHDPDLERECEAILRAKNFRVEKMAGANLLIGRR